MVVHGIREDSIGSLAAIFFIDRSCSVYFLLALNLASELPVPTSTDHLQHVSADG